LQRSKLTNSETGFSIQPHTRPLVIGLYLGVAVVSAVEIFEAICLLVYVALQRMRGLSILQEKTLDSELPTKHNGKKKSVREIVEEMEERHRVEMAQLRKDMDELIRNSHLEQTLLVINSAFYI
jgi:hypothetical protein